MLNKIKYLGQDYNIQDTKVDLWWLVSVLVCIGVSNKNEIKKKQNKEKKFRVHICGKLQDSQQR